MAGNKDGRSCFLSYNFSLQEFTLFMRQSFGQHASLISSYQNVESCLKQKVLDIGNEKVQTLVLLPPYTLMVNLSVLLANVVIFLSRFFCKSSVLVLRAK